jgi:hypothetical protein
MFKILSINAATAEIPQNLSGVESASQIFVLEVSQGCFALVCLRVGHDNCFWFNGRNNMPGDKNSNFFVKNWAAFLNPRSLVWRWY